MGTMSMLINSFFLKDCTREIHVMKNRISNLPLKNLLTQVQIVVSISLT